MSSHRVIAMLHDTDNDMILIIPALGQCFFNILNNWTYTRSVPKKHLSFDKVEQETNI